MSLTGSEIELLQHEFDAERAAILASAVGIARVELEADEPLNALHTLETAAAATRRLHRRFLMRCGYSEQAVDDLLRAV